MPTIGNGYIGATIYDDSIFMNGVYEGTGGQQLSLFLMNLVLSRQALDPAALGHS